MRLAAHMLNTAAFVHKQTRFENNYLHFISVFSKTDVKARNGHPLYLFADAQKIPPLLFVESAQKAAVRKKLFFT